MKKPARPTLEGLEGLFFGPAVWALYFALAYATAAVWCARYAGPGGALGTARVLILTYAAIALVAILLNAWRGFRHGYSRDAGPPHDEDSDADRHRFLGFASLLLSSLAAVATIYVTLPVLLVGSCHP